MTHILAVDRERLAFAFEPDAPALMEVHPPADLIVETLDARCGLLRSANDVETSAPDFSALFPRTNPMTGPIRIAGAQPGDDLVIEILGIELDSTGFAIVKPDRGLVQELVSKPVAKVLPIEGDRVRFGELHLPLRPMIGVVDTWMPSGAARE